MSFPAWILDLQAERDRLRSVNTEMLAALIQCEDRLAEDGCDCGVDEPGTCALCGVRAVLAKAQGDQP